MTSNHALGPWIAVDYLSTAELIKSADGKELAMRQDGASVADMRLMVAAPELLEACKAALVYDQAIRACANDPDRMSSFCTAEGNDLDALYFAWMSMSQAAIAKVRGDEG